MLEYDSSRYFPDPSVISDPSVKVVNTTSSDSLITDNKKTVRETESVAVYLVDKFNHPGGKQFYYRVAWRLDRNVIDRLVALAFDNAKTSPGRYFSKCAKREMGES